MDKPMAEDVGGKEQLFSQVSFDEAAAEEQRAERQRLKEKEESKR